MTETPFFKMQKTTLHLNSAEDTLRLGASLGSCVEGPLVIGLTGNLGAGKTTLTQALAEAVGIDDAVSSPTFLMMNEYHAEKISLYHFDLYRLQEDLDLESQATRNLKQELDEIMLSADNVVAVVEWLNLWEAFAAEYDELRINIEHVEDGGRNATLSARGKTAEKVLRACQEKMACF